MPTVQQLPPAVAVNLTDEIMLDQSGTSVAATVAQVLGAQPLGAGIVRNAGTLAADMTVLAPLASPALTGTPTAPTPPAGDNSTHIATTAFVLANSAAAGSGGTLTLTGDVSGAGSGTIDTTLATVATAGTYEKVTIDAKGRVLAGSTLGGADIDAALGYTPLAGNQTITLGGDITGSGATAITATLAAVATPGTYEKVTVDAKGRVLAGSTLGGADIDAALGYTPLAGNQTITLAGDITGSGATAITATLAAVATPGTFAKVTIDAKGRVLSGTTLSSGDLAGALPGADASAADVAATGAPTARSLAARAADRVNVLDYGADPTGAADSAPAFTAAMADVSGTWGVVLVPRGTYRLDSAVNQPAGHSIRVQFDDGANITGSGYLGVDCVESRQGAFRLKQVSGGFFGFAPAVGDSANPGFVTDWITNTAQNSRSMRVGWDRRYTNTNLYGKTHTGIDIAEQRIHSWPNLYDNSSGWGLWQVIEGTTLDEDTAARAGLSTSAEISESDVVNNAHEAGWTWHSGAGNGVQGMSIDPWGQNGNYGGNILFAYGSVGSYFSGDGLNQRWFCYPAVFSAGNPGVAAGTLVVNATTVTLTGGETLAAVAAAINAAAIPGVAAAVNTWGGVVSRLVIYGTTAGDQGTLTLSGTALASLGISGGTYTTPRGAYAAVIGGNGSVAVGSQFVVQGTTVTVGGAGGMADAAAAINAANLAGIAADTNASGNLVVTAFMPQNPGGLVLADVSGAGTLAGLGLSPGTYLPPTPPKAFATAYSDQTSPVCLTTDQITISATDLTGAVHGPVTVTLSGGAGTGWPADVAASISAALATAGMLSGDFTARSSGSAVVAVRAVGAGGSQGVQIRNTAGGTLTLADAHGTPLETLGIAPGTYQPGGYSAGSQTVFMAAEDSIAPGGRGVFVGGVSDATDLTVFPHTPFEARGGFLHGIRLDNAGFNDNNAIVVAPTHAIAWGSKAQGQHVLAVNAGTLTFDGQPFVNSGVLDGTFGAEVGDMLVRGASGWVALTPGAQGQVLETGGGGVPLAWTTVIPNLPAGALLSTSGTPGVAGTVALTTVLDAEIGSEYGDILYRGVSGWVALTPGTAGQVLQSAGAGAAPLWATPAGGSGSGVSSVRVPVHGNWYWPAFSAVNQWPALYSALTAAPFFLAAEATPQQLGIYVSSTPAAGGLDLHLGIYTDVGGLPGALVAGSDTGLLTATAAGAASGAVSPGALAPGWYWLATFAGGGGDGCNVNCTGHQTYEDDWRSPLGATGTPGALAPVLGVLSGAAPTFGALPATFPSPALSGDSVPIVYVQF